MIDCQYVRGSFQPLTSSTVRAIRASLRNARKTIVLVRPAKRGPDAPFSFEEVRGMWEEAFCAEAHDGRLVVRPDEGIPPGGKEISLQPDEEGDARAELATVGDPLWALALPHAVRVAIRNFDGSWRDSLHRRQV